MAQSFQRLMDSVCQGMEFAYVYIDDILVASRDTKSHTQHLRLLFQRLQEHGLVINASECKFGCSTLHFLGHHISSAGISPLPEKVEAITRMEEPKTIKGLQCFVGMINFYRRFIPAAARIMALLFDPLTGKPKALVWNAEMVKAFPTPSSHSPMQHYSRILIRTHQYHLLRMHQTEQWEPFSSSTLTRLGYP